ncbi:DNA repair ATPase [Streptomyces sp. TRM 70351]|uniref:DNA repair ATPase n=1 Tax=Streptomyces sp. TRM 70351 TaxID=3116552 RepID=UPI002E7AD58D|nr:DNA repair ATPase [Streptomyces sp. TRM 70351]MEE1928240.1 DNA repair ATPase [Streptomyces sp. TRM 70351]
MTAAARELARRAQALDARRVEVFGGSALELAGNDRLRTARPGVPRDVAQVGGMLLAGYQAPPEPGRDTAVGDVLALYRQRDGRFTEAGPDALPGLLDDPAFRRDFAELHRYYRQARLLRLRRTGPLLLAVFQTGERATDLRVLRWRVAPDGTPAYLDDQGERDHVLPPAHDVTWTPVRREDHVPGRHPHIAVDGTLYVSTVGGALTVKDTDDTETDAGIYREPVDEPLQSLADAEVAYARVGPLLLLRVRPYKETADRHLVHNERTGEVVRLDGVGLACRRLPEDQGIVFPGGYYLSNAPAGAAARTFDTDTAGLRFEAAVRAPGGEDVLFVFHAPAAGRGLLLPYHLIREEVATPIPAQGHALFDDGTLVVLRGADAEPSRVHPVQVWRTPYVSEEHAAARPPAEGPLGRIGNAELVRGISDVLSVARMADGMAPGAAVFEAITAACAKVADTHYWLDGEGLEALHEPLAELGGTAAQVTEEFARFEEARERARAALAGAAEEVTALVRRSRAESPGGADAWVDLLTGLHRAQGRVETLRELRHADLGRIAELGAELAEAVAAAGRRAVAFLARPEAFDATRAEIAGLTERASGAGTVADADALGERVARHAEGLRAVTDVVGGLDIDDVTVRTVLLERVGEVLGAVNRARAVLDGRRRELREREGRAEFTAEYALFGQAVAGALAAADTPEECDEQLGRLLLRLEHLESRFGTFEEYARQLAERREEVHEAFSARKQARLDERARHTERLARSADRLLATVTRRSAALGGQEEVAAYFAADPLVAKVRATAGELRAAGDAVRAQELEGRLKAARQEAARALRDRADLYDAEGTVRLGRHRFAVTGQPADLTLVPQDGALAFAVTGTDYRAPVRDAAFAATRAFWDQPLPSESPEVYRAEHLAAAVLAATGADGLRRAAATGDGLAALTREYAAGAYDEGYDRGVHDRDAAAVLAAVLELHAGADLLRYPGSARAAAQLFWAYGTDEASRAGWLTRARSLGRARTAFGAGPAVAELAGELAEAVRGFAGRSGLTAGEGDGQAAGEYLFEELALGGPRFATSAAARALLDGFRAALGGPGSAEAGQFAADLRALDGDVAARHQLVHAWLHAYAATGKPGEDGGADLPEAVAVELGGEAVPRREVTAPLHTTVTGLLGSHPRLSGGELPLRLDEFLARTDAFRTRRVPAHRAYTRQRAALLAAERERLRLADLRPKVMSAFVRNRLIDEVYLPLIGDNLAKQLGTAGEERRTDSQGLLFLLSPPGYGKTTLLEYVAARLGLVFVRVDGPALGHRTTSLDPAAAPDAAARREVEKANFALEMGNNVLLYLDDVQHLSPELLQKFIPLCDAQRRIDGVSAADGQPRTYDLRGKRFAVAMAGNPFTESGARFRVPDMLANRADVWNLGDVLTGKEDVFALSHVENALTANPVLAPLASRDRADLDLLVRLASGDATAHADRLVHPYEPGELERITAVLRRLLHVRRTVLAVNAAYIASATQDDTARTEPPFRLQGSYRNTARLAERIVPVMNDAELEALIDDHYLAEAQTLTTGAEANLLKLAELRGRLTDDQRARWAEIKAAHTAARTARLTPAAAER